MKTKIKFYNDRIAINVLAGDLENASDIYEAIDGHALVGLLSKDYSTIDEASKQMNVYKNLLNNSISVGLGAGDPSQWEQVALISKQVKPAHINQVFTGVGYTSALAEPNTIINGLIRPSGKEGYVIISTGPSSSSEKPAIVDVNTALKMLKDMGANSVKYYPMTEMKDIKEFIAVCRACKKNDMIIEPTGGIGLENFKEIVSIALEENVKKIIPHVYSSIIDKESGMTNVADVEKLYEIIKEIC